MKNNHHFLYFIWNVLVAVATSYIAVVIPAHIVMDVNVSFPILEYLQWMCSLIFITDVFVQIQKRRKYATRTLIDDSDDLKTYYKTWFIVDVIAALPLYMFINLFVFQLILMIKLLKILHMMKKLKYILIQWSNALTIIYFFFWFMLLTHWVSCVWILLTGMPVEQTVITTYIKALYWSTTTLATVGYGDIVPKTDLQMIYAIFVEILGVSIYAFLIGNIAGIMSKKDPAKAQFVENIEKLNVLLHYRQIPVVLQEKIRDYYIYLWRKKLGFNESSFLHGLPENLKMEVAVYLKQDVIEKIPLFKDASFDFIKETALQLKPVVLTPGDYLFKAGDIGEEMYFVISGELSTLDKEETKVVFTLKEGDFFGEIALFLNKPRTATIKANTYCDLYKLRKKEFDIVIHKFPEITEKIKEKIAIREQRYSHDNCKK